MHLYLTVGQPEPLLSLGWLWESKSPEYMNSNAWVFVYSVFCARSAINVVFVQIQNNGVPKAGIHGRRCAQSYFGWPFTCERWGRDQSLKITLRHLSLYHHSSFHAPGLLFKGKSLVSMLFLSCLTVCRGNQRSTSEVFYVREQRAVEESFDLSKWKGCSLPFLEFLFIFACFRLD